MKWKCLSLQQVSSYTKMYRCFNRIITEQNLYRRRNFRSIFPTYTYMLQRRNELFIDFNGDMTKLWLDSMVERLSIRAVEWGNVVTS